MDSTLTPTSKDGSVDDADTVGGIIAKARKAAGMNQQELADAIGVSRAAVGQFETGKTNPGGDTAQTIAKVLHLDKPTRARLLELRAAASGRHGDRMGQIEDDLRELKQQVGELRADLRALLGMPEEDTGSPPDPPEAD